MLKGTCKACGESVDLGRCKHWHHEGGLIWCWPLIEQAIGVSRPLTDMLLLEVP